MENSRDDDVASAANIEEGPVAAFTIEVLFLDPHEKSLEICQPLPWAYPMNPIPYP